MSSAYTVLVLSHSFAHGAGGSTVLALRSAVPGEACTVEHLRSMLALFGPVSAGQRVPLPEPESNALEAHAFRFERPGHAEQAAQVRPAVSQRPLGTCAAFAKRPTPATVACSCRAVACIAPCAISCACYWERGSIMFQRHIEAPFAMSRRTSSHVRPRKHHNFSSTLCRRLDTVLAHPLRCT